MHNECATETERRKSNNMRVSLVILLVGIDIWRKFFTFFYCNQQDTNELEHWSACTHASFGQTKMEQCTHLICVYFNLNLCAK